MNSNKLSHRLEKVADFVKEYGKTPIRLADIGSDHAYLPCNLMLNQVIDYAIAGEVVEGPFESAKKEVALQGLTDSISVRFGDGLDVVNLNDLINLVTICGMGGVLIRNILKAGYQNLSKNHLLVLQPNMAEYQLRQWLVANHYHIIDEAIIFEQKHSYEVIVAQYQPDMDLQELTEKELYFGPINLSQHTNEFVDKWQRELDSTQRIMESIRLASSSKSDKLVEMESKYNLIKEVL